MNVLAAAAVSVPFVVAVGSSVPQGSVIVAKSSGDVVILWQATPEVASLIAGGPEPGSVLTALRDDAMQIILAKRPSFDKGVTSIAVNIIYARSAGVSAVYNADTFGGFEKLMTVRASRLALAQYRSWPEDIRARRLPAGVTVSVTGSLPPTH